MSNELPFRSQAGEAASQPGPAGGVIPPYQEGARSGSVPAGGEWAPEADGMPRSSDMGGVTFRPGFSADGSAGEVEEDFTQKPPSGGM